MTADTILNRYYKNATYKYCPDFDYNDSTIQAELLPGYEYTNWIVQNIFEARPDYEKKLSEDGYDIVYHIVDKYDDNKEFIGIVVDNRLLDITDDLNVLLGEDNKVTRPGYEGDNFMDKLVHGRELYNSYGPDVDPNDLDEYDAECYLAYKRVFVGASTSIVATSKEIEDLINGQRSPAWKAALRKIDWQISFEDADRLINGNEDGEQRMVPDHRIVTVSYPNDAQLERARQNDCDKAFIITYDDGRQSMIAYDSATDDLGKYFERKLLDYTEEG